MPVIGGRLSEAQKHKMAVGRHKAAVARRAGRHYVSAKEKAAIRGLGYARAPVHRRRVVHRRHLF